MGCGVVTQFMNDHGVVMNGDISMDHVGAGVSVKQVPLKAGQEVIKHKHDYDHLSVLVSGKVTVVTDEYEIEMEGPESITIKAGLYHHISALTDALWLCVHPTESVKTCT